jgi:menaquinone-9 beta-reductase
MAWRETRDRMAGLNQEICIAGGGLAGLSLGVALRRSDVPVRILEAGEYPRHRVCGEFISGVSDETLVRLGIAEHFSDALKHRSLGWYDRGKLIHEDHFKQAAFGISRYLLDARLVKQFRDLGGVLETRSRARPEAGIGKVWAAGRRPCRGRWIGLKAHLRNLPQTADLEMHAGANGYVGLAGVEGGWTNVCGLFRLDRSQPGKGESLLPAYLEAGGNVTLAASIRAAEWKAGSFSAVAGFELGPQVPLPGLLMLGDAESMIPPFTGNGMSMAFQAAECALDPLTAWSRGEIAWEKAAQDVRGAVKRRFARRMTVAQALHPILLAASGRALLGKLAARHLLPFQPMLSLIR